MRPADSPDREADTAGLARGRRIAELLGLANPAPQPLAAPAGPERRPPGEERPLWKPLAAVVVLLFLAAVTLTENEAERLAQASRSIRTPAPQPPRQGRSALNPPPATPVPPAVADDRLDLPRESVWQGTIRHEGEYCLAELSLRRKEGAGVTGVLSWERRGMRHSVTIAGRTIGSRLSFESGTILAGTALTNARGVLTSFHEGRSLSGDYWSGAKQGAIRLVRKD